MLMAIATNAAAESPLPSGGDVVAGSADIAQSGAHMTINQHSNKAVINWQSFDIGADHTVTFQQPGANAMALNRVITNNPSEIFGTLNANGQVWLINPNGVLFGNGASVNVGGLVASTLAIGNQAFLDGNYTLTGDGGTVVNNGQLHVTPGGYIALIGGQVSNNGVMVAKLGTVALAAGNKVTLDFAGNSLVDVTVDQATLDALVANHQLIKADGGKVLLTAKAANTLLTTVVNNTGIVQARTVQNENGVIKLMGGFDNDAIQVAGTLDASAPDGGDGGFIETSAANVQIADSIHVTTAAPEGDTGTWLIDPTNFTVAAGSDSQTTSSIGANTLQTSLASNNVTLETAGSGSEAGDINVNADVTWGANTLTLNAHNDININAVLTAEGSAGLALNYGGTDGDSSATPVDGSSLNMKLTDAGFVGRVDITGTGNSVSINGANYTIITGLGTETSSGDGTLQGMMGDLAGHYVLGDDITIGSADDSWNGGKGFDPVGEFSGTFDGLGHTINGLTINRPETNKQGLFSVISSNGTVRNVGLVGGSITGKNFVGGLAGKNNGLIHHVRTTGTVNGAGTVGGVVGKNLGEGKIQHAYATGEIRSTDGNNIGGLVGSNYGTVVQSHATGTITGERFIGGLVGFNGGTIKQSYATGKVTGSGSPSSEIGGLAGANDTDAKILQSYATGSVSGSKNIGGLVGRNKATVNMVGSELIKVAGTIKQSYATGSVSGDINVGGLVGKNLGSINYAYAIGEVTGTTDVGGLVGKNEKVEMIFPEPSFPPADPEEITVTGDIQNSYWDAEASGLANGCSAACAGATGKTTAEMKQIATFDGWDFSSSDSDPAVWVIDEGTSYPSLAPPQASQEGGGSTGSDPSDGDGSTGSDPSDGGGSTGSDPSDGGGSTGSNSSLKSTYEAVLPSVTEISAGIVQDDMSSTFASAGASPGGNGQGAVGSGGAPQPIHPGFQSLGGNVTLELVGIRLPGGVERTRPGDAGGSDEQ